ncbi:MAG: hypothetical protein KDD36_09640 [Flavobacteriales bacterium]|nr:hypothetical protein [Flavobacteriales bacterium]
MKTYIIASVLALSSFAMQAATPTVVTPEEQSSLSAVRSQIQHTAMNLEFNEASLNGTHVILTFYVDDSGELHILNAKGDSRDLNRIVSNAIVKGDIDTGQLEAGKAYRIKIGFDFQ